MRASRHAPPFLPGYNPVNSTGSEEGTQVGSISQQLPHRSKRKRGVGQEEGVVLACPIAKGEVVPVSAEQSSRSAISLNDFSSHFLQLHSP